MGPEWGVLNGVRKMSPELWSGSAVTVTGGGFRPGAERKLVDGRAEAAPSSLVPFTTPWAPAAAIPTPNEKLSAVDPGSPDALPAAGEVRAARTVTCSPAVNRARGTNAVPAPSGRAVSRPACHPLRDPITVTEVICEGAREEKMTCVPGAASGVPGKGITWSAAAWADDAPMATAIAVASRTGARRSEPTTRESVPLTTRESIAAAGTRLKSYVSQNTGGSGLSRGPDPPVGPVWWSA